LPKKIKNKMKNFLLATLFLFVTGCAETRFLTKELDRAFYEACENGCIVVPMPVEQTPPSPVKEAPKGISI
jgi:hypothetical protein